ncbi:MAG: 1-acyl-sn-glycerol-3-phosphate acyltransferase [Spirochaetaceae bacterium]|nr:MAG: 1-acyl-sn-glycerol-3-phosphate acyltransferase [Spirochaetaceae bacterium]
MNERRARRRDLRRGRRRIHAPRHVNTILRNIVGPTLGWLFHIETENRALVKRLKGPYLLIANHACVLDPFMINCQIPAPVHYVVSDSNFRSRLVDFALGLVGSIPKTKAVSDLETVKNIVKVKAHGGIIGLYPEGQNTWDGHTLPIYPATAKLVKSLKIPVVAAKVQGAFLSLPRWARSFRRGRIVISFDQVFTVEELRAATLDEVHERLVSALEHDESEWQRTHRVIYRGKHRAEYLEIVLCVCPHCNTIGTLVSEGEHLGCSACGYRVRMTAQGFFTAASDHRPAHDSIRAWNLWQSDFLTRSVEQYAQSDACEPLFEEPRVIAKTGYKSRPLEPLANGRLQFFSDRIRLIPETGAPAIDFPIAGIEGINVQNSEHLEFYLGGNLYKMTIDNRRGNTYKWHLAVKHLQSLASSGGETAAGARGA